MDISNEVHTKIRKMFNELYHKTKNIKYTHIDYDYNTCYNFYDITISVEDIPLILEHISDYDLDAYTELNGFWGVSDLKFYSCEYAMYSEKESYTVRLWIYTHNTAKTPLDRQHLMNVYNTHMHYINSFGVSRYNFIWDAWTSNNCESVDGVHRDGCGSVKVYNTFKDYYNRTSRTVTYCKINGKDTYKLTQYGTNKDNFDAIKSLLSTASPNTTFSNVYDGYANKKSRERLKFIFLNDGSFSESEFRDYMAANHQKDKIKGGKVNVELSEKEKIEREIARLQQKLKKLNN